MHRHDSGQSSHLTLNTLSISPNVKLDKVTADRFAIKQKEGLMSMDSAVNDSKALDN